MLVSVEREGNQGSRKRCAWAFTRCGLLRWCLPQPLAVLCGSPVSALKCMHGEGVQLMHLQLLSVPSLWVRIGSQVIRLLPWPCAGSYTELHRRM